MAATFALEGADTGKSPARSTGRFGVVVGLAIVASQVMLLVCDLGT